MARLSYLELAFARQVRFIVSVGVRCESDCRQLRNFGARQNIFLQSVSYLDSPNANLNQFISIFKNKIRDPFCGLQSPNSNLMQYKIIELFKFHQTHF